jgi:adhesin HecA-like repeat protein
VRLDHSVRRLALSPTFHRPKAATLLRVLKTLLPADDGAALVEGALILPVFLLLVGFVYEFGFFLYQEQLVTSGVEDAARYLALSADPNGADIQADAKNLAVTGSINGGKSRINGWSTSDVSITVDSVDNAAGTYSGGSTIQVVTVSTNYLDPTLGFLTLLHLKPPTITVSHQERVVGGSAPGQG